MADTRYDTPEPFKVDIPERALIDLDERLRRWRPPTSIADNGSWASGTDPAFLAELVDYWRHGYDWQRCQEAINRWPNYLVDIGPQRLHFIREPGTEVEDAPRPLPLVVTHGWPGSIVEFLHVIDALAHPEEHGGDPLDAFDVIVPSLPGYGFSGPPIREDGTTGPIGPRAIAGLWNTLVTEKLNYDRPYGIQGGDWGAVVSSWLAFDHPQKDEAGVLGLHLNMMGLRPGLDLKTRTLICVVSDASTGRYPELDIHLRFALKEGWTEKELFETLLHLSGYVGLPLIREALYVAKEVFEDERKKKAAKK